MQRMTRASEIASAFHERGLVAGPYYENLVRLAYEYVLQPGECAFDCGANWGLHTVPMARCVGPNGTLHAFEPLDEAIEGLNAAVARAGVEQQVRVHQVALGNANQKTEFRKVIGALPLSSLRPMYQHSDKTIDIVAVMEVRLDDYFSAPYPTPAFVKADIEGGELDLFLGAVKLLKRSRAILVFENGRHKSAVAFEYSKKDFFSVFESLGYRLFSITGDPFQDEHWRIHPYPFYAIAIPEEYVTSHHFIEYMLEMAEKTLGSFLSGPPQLDTGA